MRLYEDIHATKHQNAGESNYTSSEETPQALHPLDILALDNALVYLSMKQGH